jgi:tetratricopeptide (TPR) repeat protein
MRLRRAFLVIAVLVGADDLLAQTAQASNATSLLMQCARAAEQVADVACRRVLDGGVLETGIEIPEEPTLYLRLGRLLAERGQIDRAIKLYRAGVRAFPNNGEFPYLLAKSLVEVDACLEAYGPALEAMKRGPKTVPLQLLLGQIELCRGASEQAQGYFTAARDQGARFEAYEGLGLALAASGRHEAALAQFEIAGKLRPDERALVVFRGRSLQALGRFQEAAAAFGAVLSDPVWRAEGYCGLALAFRALGETAKAKAACERAFESGQHRSPGCACARQDPPNR